MTDTPWWQTATGYQIWPRSFQDSDGDGLGDLPGITARLDHLADLGVGFIWLSPVYASPMADMGYDIADYRAIAPEFGTLADFDRLLVEARARNIRIVMDLVVNHSSSEHAWFRAARASRDAPEHDFYIWRDAPPDRPPSPRRAAFGGPAWTWVSEVGRWYLHVFSPEQPDLNWGNPALRAEIHDMMTWWLDRGVAGFRMDVIDLIGKDVDGDIFEHGPHLHGYLREMHDRVLKGRDVLTVGEAWSATPETGLLYCGRDRGELDMLFQFNHIASGWHPERGKWHPLPFDLVAMKRVLFDWQEVLAEDGWNSLFLSNHDLPRQVSRYGDPGTHRGRSAKCIATAIHLMKGTPYIYQGEEIGMTNIAFDRIDQFRDIETLRHYAERIAAGVPQAEFLAGANATGRDNARTPMQWDAGPNAGFTDATPWIAVNPNHEVINAAADRADPHGVIAHYRRLIALRRDDRTVSHGRFVPALEDHPQVMAYSRHRDGQRIVVVANWSGEAAELDIPKVLAVRGEALLWTVARRDDLHGRVTLAPWEAVAIRG